MERPSGDPPGALPAAARPPDPVQRWRLTLRRRADAPLVAQREWQQVFEASLVASGLPLAMTEPGGSRPRVAIAAPLGQGIAAERELAEIFLLRRSPVWAVREAVAAVLPEGHELVAVEDVWLGEPAIAGRVVAADYELRLDGEAAPVLGPAIDAAVAATALPRRRSRGERVVDYDLRPFIEALQLDGDVLRMRLRHDPEKGVGRPDEVLAELAERSGATLDPAALVRTGLVLAPPRSAPAGERPPGARPASSGRGRRP